MVLERKPEQGFEQLAEKITDWFGFADLCEWSITHQHPSEDSMDEILRREELLLNYINKFNPEHLIQFLTINSPKAVGINKTLAILASIPIEKLEINENSKQVLSAFAIRNLQAFDREFIRSSIRDSAPPVKIARGLSKRGLLNWLLFISREDGKKIELQLQNYYYKLLISGMKGKVQHKEMPSGFYENDYIPFSLSPESQQKLKSYFGETGFGLKINRLKSSEDPEYKNELSGLQTGDPKEEKFTQQGFPMSQLSWFYMPGEDLRLNFNFGNRIEDIVKQAKVLSKLMAFAQIKGIPITSKFADSEDREKYSGRVAIYTDQFQAKYLMIYLKRNYLIEWSPNSQDLSDSNMQIDLSGEGAITLRGNGESFGNDKEVLKTFFDDLSKIE